MKFQLDFGVRACSQGCPLLLESIFVIVAVAVMILSYVQEISLSGVVIDDITFDPPPLADASGNVRRQLIVVKALRRPACYRDIIKCQISLDSTV